MSDQAQSAWAALPLPKNLVRRTEAGKGLRLEFDDLRASIPEIPEGAEGRLEVGYVHEDRTVKVGGAWLTEKGWEVDAAIGVAVRQGISVRVLGGITFGKKRS